VSFGEEGASGIRSPRKDSRMATAQDALQKMREICLSLPDTREGVHFGEAAFYVKGKLFATCGEKNGICQITFGLTPDHVAALVQSDTRFKPYPRDRRGVVLDVAEVTDWNEVEALIRQSYELQKPPVAAKAAKKPRPGGRG
jgi:predicted DNA-binding protein (MmcQ/YjbR family)